MDKKSFGKCISYDRENGDCLFAKNMGHFYIGIREGIKCPYNAYVPVCNEEYHKIQWSDDENKRHKEIRLWIKYGIVPELKMTKKFLETDGTDIEGILLEGVEIIKPNGGIEKISSKKEDTFH